MIPARRALAQQVGQEEHAVGPGRGLLRLRAQQVVGADARLLRQPHLLAAQRVAEPAVGHPRRLHGAAGGVEPLVQVHPVEGAHLRVEQRLLRHERDPRRGAQHVVGAARPHHARAHAGAGAVTAADDHRRALQQLRGLRRLARDVPHHVRGGVQLGQQALRDVQRLQDLLRPLLAPDVQQIGARGVAVIGDKAPRQLVDDVVLGVQYFMGVPVDLRLVVAHPEQLGRRIRRAQPVPRDAVAALHADARDHLPLLRIAARVRPQQHGPQRLARLVHGQAAHHHARKADAQHLLRPHARALQQRPGAAAHRAPPVLRVLLDEPVLRVAGGIALHRRAAQHAVGAIERRLAAAGAQVVRQYVARLHAFAPLMSLCPYIFSIDQSAAECKPARVWNCQNVPHYAII